MRYLIVLLLLLVSSAYAAKVEITSEKFYADENASKVFFMNNVKVIKDKDRLLCELLVVYFNDKQETQKYEASGSVRFDIYRNNTHYQGSAKSVEYSVKTTQYTFRGDAIIHDLSSKRDLFGEEIILNSKTGKATVKSSDKRPSKFIFEMEN